VPALVVQVAMAVVELGALVAMGQVRESSPLAVRMAVPVTVAAIRW